MNHALKLVLALALLAALGVLAIFLWLRPANGTLALEPDRPAERALEVPRDAHVDAQAPLASEAADSARSSVQKDATPAPKSAAQETEATVVARLVDDDQRPIANGFLRAESSFVPGVEAALPAAQSGADGVVTLRCKSTGSIYSQHFAAGADGYATVFPRGIPVAGETLHLGDVKLPPGGALSGRVVDGRQRPVAGAEIAASDNHEFWGTNDLAALRERGPSLWDGAPQTTSGKDGLFRLEGVAAGMTRAWARAEGGRWSVSEPLEIPARGELRDVVLVLDEHEESEAAGSEIQGIVLDPEGKPLPQAGFSAHEEHEHGSRSTGGSAGSDGRFHYRPTEPGAKISIEFSDQQERYASVRLADLKPGTRDLVVRLREARTVTFTVTDESGPVEKFRVRWGLEAWDLHRYADKDEPHAGGVALARVPTDAAFLFEVVAPGHSAERLGPLNGSSLAAALTVRLRSIPGIRGVVLSGDAPVAGAKITLHSQPADTEIEINNFPVLLDPEKLGEATSDAQGRFAIDLHQGGRFALLTEAAGFARAQLGPLELDAAKGLADAVVRLDAGGTLEGKVLVAPGRSPAGVIVGLNRGDTKPLTQAVGPEGTFRFEHLTAGDWEIQRCDEMFISPTSTSMSSGGDTKPHTLRRDFVIAVGQTTHRDLDLREQGSCTLVLDVTSNGQPARAWGVVALARGKHAWSGSPPGATLDSAGHARLELPELGEYALTFAPPAESGSTFRFRAELTLQAGVNPWTQDIRSARILGTITDWSPDAGVRWRFGAPDSPFLGEDFVQPDASGKFAVPFVPAGKIEVLRFRDASSAAGWEKLQTLELAAGESRTLQLP